MPTISPQFSEITCPVVPVWTGLTPRSPSVTVRSLINVTCSNGTSMVDTQRNKNVKIDAELQKYVTTECTQGGEWVPELPTCIEDDSKFGCIICSYV